MTTLRDTPGDLPSDERSSALDATLVVSLNADDVARPPWVVPLSELDSLDVGRAPGDSETLAGRGRSQSLGCVDRRMSARHCRLERLDDGRFALSDLGSTNGTYLRGRRVQEPVPLADGAVFEAGRTFAVLRYLTMPPARSMGELATVAPAMASVFRTVPRLARTMLPVLIHGETGSGKERVAHAIHAMSTRGGAFVPVNCAALAPTLLEAELFGHRRGAFSGATEARVGLVRSADGGTLFLDEIGDLPLPAQATLLRVLQELEVLPVGSDRPVSVDFRLVSATHRNLTRLVEDGTFREDLLARVQGATLVLPPLRDRLEDLGLLLGTFAARYAAESGGTFTMTVQAARALFSHRWPKNVRELELCIRGALALCDGATIDLCHLPETVTGTRRSPGERATGDEPGERFASASASASGSRLPEEAARRTELTRLLLENDGNVSAVARQMGKARSQVQRWMKRYGLRGDESAADDDSGA